MKQNKMMQCASLLLVCTLFTTSTISTTFAKYTTQGSVQDSAKVAKWGVSITTEGTLFDTTYLSGNHGEVGNGVSDGANNAALSVESTGKVVAPGTKNSAGLTFKVAGKPEVDVMITVNAVSEHGDVYLHGMGLPDVTTSNDTSDTFNVESYMPVRFTLSKNGTVSDENKNLTLNQLMTKLNDLSGHYDAGTELAGENGFGTYVITWEWIYDGNDKADSLLGSLNSGSTEIQNMSLKEGIQYNLQTDLKIDIAVTQVD
ncbi:MAG: hypothetical protein IJC38_03750 [Erysipelotrichaceae bacterium]|nr:hypothetical protein [Erysipelotrichaceae bacterium]